jgi:hypothetical protein
MCGVLVRSGRTSLLLLDISEDGSLPFPEKMRGDHIHFFPILLPGGENLLQEDKKMLEIYPNLTGCL